MPNIEVSSHRPNECVHVAVAVIVTNGHVLISKRAQHVHQGGLWEFPGGKVEAGETVSEALTREIKEELGINIKASQPLISLEHDYPDKRVILDVLMVTAFEGIEYECDPVIKQKGLEGQQVKWVLWEQLKSYPFPQANQAIIEALMLPEKYLITPDCEPESNKINHFIRHLSRILANYESGRGLVQLRIKSLKDSALNTLIQQVCDIAKNNNSRIMLNSSLCFIDDSASLSMAQSQLVNMTAGVHLTSEHLYETFPERFRQQFPDKKMAASCHCKADIDRANDLKLDFIVISPVQQTASHPDSKPLGWEQFRTLTSFAKMPVFALGGMSQNDIEQAKNNGAQGISAIRSLWEN